MFDMNYLRDFHTNFFIHFVGAAVVVNIGVER